MGPVRLLIIYEPPDAVSPLCVAEVGDRHTLQQAARAAIAEAEARATSEGDPELAIDGQAEAQYLKQVLPLLVPGVVPAA